DGAVELGLPLSQGGEVGAVQHEDPRHLPRTSVSAASTSASGTNWPKRGAPRRAKSTQPMPSLLDFLSRRSASNSAPRSTVGVWSSPHRCSVASCHSISDL